MLRYKRLQGLGSGQKANGIWIALISAVVLAGCSNKQPELSRVAKIEQAVQSPERRADWLTRDIYRHPVQTLDFFQVESHHSVVEIWPGAGWYSEILAPYLKARGKYYAAHFSPDSQVGYFRRSLASYQDKLASDSRYENVELTVLQPPKSLNIAPKASVDRVLTFRNVHNWMKANTAEASFAAFYKALKPGGLLGVVEHRATPGASMERMIRSGYVTEAAVKRYAKDAGFEFVAASDVNANPNDTKIYPKGVWTLPPSLRLGEQDRALYLSIGESDRMTLLFKKPE